MKGKILMPDLVHKCKNCDSIAPPAEELCQLCDLMKKNRDKDKLIANMQEHINLLEERIEETQETIQIFPQRHLSREIMQIETEYL